ncbi:unnamed protein product [Rhodiola kirilowii]
MGRAPATLSSGLKKGPWTVEEDMKLKEYIDQHGAGNWRLLPKNAGLQRCGKSCRLRWTNYLRPDIKQGRFSFEEEEAIIQLHSVLVNKCVQQLAAVDNSALTTKSFNESQLSSQLQNHALIFTRSSSASSSGTANNAGAILVLGRDLVVVPKLIHPIPPALSPAEA